MTRYSMYTMKIALNLVFMTFQVTVGYGIKSVHIFTLEKDRTRLFS
jgi:hypothetical protein